MVCPFCLHKKTQVYNSRSVKRPNSVWRRRRCLGCKKEFTTTESADIERIVKVTKNDTQTVRFSRAQLFLSLFTICDHRVDQAETAFMLCRSIEPKILAYSASHQQTIGRAKVVELCLETLKDFDAKCYVKYLSYHTPISTLRSLKKQLL